MLAAVGNSVDGMLAEAGCEEVLPGVALRIMIPYF
jgi:hypothetical protein